MQVTAKRDGDGVITYKYSNESGPPPSIRALLDELKRLNSERKSTLDAQFDPAGPSVPRPVAVGVGVVTGVVVVGGACVLGGCAIVGAGLASVGATYLGKELIFGGA